MSNYESIWTGVLRPFLIWLTVCWACGFFIASAFGFHWGTYWCGVALAIFTLPAAIAGFILAGSRK